MATSTTNYGFKKPDESDFYDVSDQNKNWDLADETLKNLDTPTFEDYTESTAVPSAADAIDQIKSKGKLGTLLSNIKAAFKGACLIGHIVNNCVTDNAGLPLSAAQGKVLKDLYTQLYSEMGTAIFSTDLFSDYSVPTFVRWGGATANNPYKAGYSPHSEGFAIVFGTASGYHTVIAGGLGGPSGGSACIHTFENGVDCGWRAYSTKDDLKNAIDFRGNASSIKVRSGDNGLNNIYFDISDASGNTTSILFASDTENAIKLIKNNKAVWTK